jgi:hypothetical protein
MARPLRPKARARAVAVALLAAAAATAAGCGSAEPAPGPDAPPSLGYEKRSVDVGSAREVRDLVDLMAGMQRDFRARDMAAVCERVSSSWLSQFPPGAEDDDEPCRVKLAEFARSTRRAGVRRRALDIARVRVYGGIAGITVHNGRTGRYRIPFVPEDGAWKLQLGVFPEPKVLWDRLNVD